MRPSSNTTLCRASALLLGLTALQATVQAQASPTARPGIETLRRSSGTGMKDGSPLSTASGFTAATSQQEVHFVEATGAVLAAGANYKAMFSAEGMVFVPFFGSDAPRNYPVHFRLTGATVGQHSLQLIAPMVSLSGGHVPLQPQVSRNGNRVSIHHGPITEQFELQLDSMEQLFHIKSLPTLPAGDDLVLELSVSTELAADEGANGLVFSNEIGWVEYTSAVVFDATGHIVSAPTTLEGGGISIRVPAGFLSQAVFPITVDPVLAAFTLQEAKHVNQTPDVAYDETNDVYCVVWDHIFSKTDQDVWSALVDSEGNEITGSRLPIEIFPFVRRTYSDSTKNPSRVANNNHADEFLVVFSSIPSPIKDPETGEYHFFGWPISYVDAFGYAVHENRNLHECRTRRADNTGASWPGASILEQNSDGGFDVGGDSHVPLISADETVYLIAIELSNVNTNHDFGIGFYFLDTKDKPGPGLDTWPSSFYLDLSVGQNPVDHGSIDVSNCNGPDLGQRAWNIVWSEEYAQNDHDIWGVQVSSSGNFLTVPFPIDNSPLDERSPSVSSPLHQLTSNGVHPYMVTYQRDNSQVGQGTDIMGRVMQWGTPMTPPTNLTQLEGGLHLNKSQFRPAVDTDGTSFLVAYTELFANGTWDLDIRASSFDFLGNALVPRGSADMRMTLAIETSMEWQPRVTSVQSGTDGLPANPHRFMAVWQDLDLQAGGSEIEGSVLDLGQ